MKRYTLELIINEGNDHFWDDITERKVTGCEDVQQAVCDVLGQIGWITNGEHANCDLRLINYTNKR